MTSLVAGLGDGAVLGVSLQRRRAVRAAREPAGDPGDGGGGDAGGGGRRCWRRRSGSTGCRSRWRGWGMGYIIAVARFVAGLGGAVIGRAGRAAGEPGADRARRAHGGALDRAGALGGAGAGGARRSRSGRGHDRPDVLIADNGRLFGDPDARRGGCCRATRATAMPPRAGSRTTATSRPRRRPMRGGSSSGAKNRIVAEVPGLGSVRLCRRQGRGEGGGALRGGGDPDRAELVGGAGWALPLRRRGAAAERGGAGDPGHGATGSRSRAPGR